MKEKLIYSFPIQLLFLHLRKNLALVFIWGILLGVICEQIGSTLGIPFLFLDPEYLNKVTWLSFFLMGIGFAILTMAFHMTTYIMDASKFVFLTLLRKPFIHYCINNSIIPLIFYLIYISQFIFFQLDNDLEDQREIFNFFLGFSGGSLISYLLIFGYFAFSNKDFFILFADTLDKRLRKVKLTRVNVLEQYKELKVRKNKVLYFINLKLKTESVRPDIIRFEGAQLLKVFDQNHLNLFFIQVFLISIVLFLGFFKENPMLQFPAAMSVTLLLAILVMLVGALNFWLRSWSMVAVVAMILLINHISNFSFLHRPHEAFGMDYSQTPAPYSLDRLEKLLVTDTIAQDKIKTIEILDNWKSKFDSTTKPKLAMIAASGGGLRSSVWTFSVLQAIYSIQKGEVIRHTELMSGASGGVFGMAFFRELYLRSLQDSTLNLQAIKFRDQISSDNLNPIIFTLLVNDLLIRNQYFTYNGRRYLKDRGFAFENQLNINTGGILDKPISAYQQSEYEGIIPLLPVTSLITNDGRKLIISPHSMGYLGTSIGGKQGKDEKKQSVDFMRFFAQNGAKDLRFLTALRMSATFPFITPSIQLPSIPVMETMDIGLSDNFGIQDALRFMYVFQQWIAENTSGVVLITIRDSQKTKEIASSSPPQFLERIFIPLKNIYSNWDHVQTIQNEVLYNYMAETMSFDLEKIEFEYNPEQVSNHEISETEAMMNRASLNWRLTTREKKSIFQSLKSSKNQEALQRLRVIFDDSQ